VGEPPNTWRPGFPADQGMSLRLGLEHADGLATDVEQVIDLAGQHRELADRDPESRRDVHLALILNRPAALSELAVDVLPGSVFRVHLRSRGSPPQGLAHGVRRLGPRYRLSEVNACFIVHPGFDHSYHALYFLRRQRENRHSG
jgi:hypothetical protein